MSAEQTRALGWGSAFIGLAVLVAGAILLIVINHCDPNCLTNPALGISILCIGLFLTLAGFMTAVSGVLRIRRQTYLVVTGAVLVVTAAGLCWFALTFDPLF